MRARYVNEKFSEDSDPIKDMGIGIDVIVEKFKNELYNCMHWLKEEDLFKYHPEFNMIYIDCYIFSEEGHRDTVKRLKKVIENYKEIFTITHIPTYENTTTDDCYIKIKVG